MLEILGSVDSLENCTQIHTDFEENAVFPLKCWQNVCLSEIWIPSNLLPSRNKTSDSPKTNRGVFHTLQKRDSSKYIETFSVYTDSDVENEEEKNFESDSDSDLILDLEDTKTGIEKSSENILSTASTISPSLSEINDITEENTKSYFHKDVISTSVSSVNAKINCDNSSLLSEICNYLEKDSERNSLHNVENICDNSQKLNTNVSKSSYLCDTTIISKNSFDISENINAGKLVKTIKADKLSDDVAKQNLPLMQSMLSFCDQFHDVGLQHSGTSEKNLCSAKSKNDTFSEILNSNLKFSIKELPNKLKNNDSSLNKFEKKTASHLKRNSKRERQMKKKASKYIPLDEFVEDEPYEDDGYDSFYYHVLLQSKLSDDLPLKSNIEFPDLISKTPKCIKSETENDPEIGLKSLINIISEPSESTVNDTANNCDEKVPFIKDEEVIFGKFVIENIPLEVAKDDISTILSGYGEIKKFLLEVTGNFLRARVEMDLICDVDWIIECLNGSEPFGASSTTLKCYKE